MNYKKKRPINTRSGCKLCKPWKINKPRKNSALDIQEKRANEMFKDLLDMGVVDA